MKYIKAGSLVVGLVFLAAACNNTPPAVQTNSGTSQQTITPTQPEQPQSTTQTYNNGSYNFSFMYGNDFSFVNPTYGTLKNQVVQVQMGNANYPNTNFGDADLTVSQDYAKTQTDCLKLPLANGTTGGMFANPQTINGSLFYSQTTSDAGAGNVYNGTTYRTYHGSDCIDVSETIHTTNIGNYPAGTVTEIDPTPIKAELDQILNSFKFTK